MSNDGTPTPEPKIPLDYHKPEPQQLSLKTPVPRSVLWLVTAIGVLVIAYLIEIRVTQQPYGYSKPKCASNLHQIGLGILLYCNDHLGQYPDSLQTILLNEQLTPDVFTCPASNDVPSTAPTTQAQADDMAKPGHVSYIYLGKGMNDKTVGPNWVIAYEPLTNHGDGMNVLCGDGHVEFINATRGRSLIAAVAATKRPVMLPP